MAMSRGLKIYAGVLAAAVIVTTWSLVHTPARTREINAKLAADAVLSAYPYRFRVLELDGTTAVMTTPRSPAAPVINMIGAIHPELAGVSETDPAFQKAQSTLAEHQSRARELVLAEPDVGAVTWRLDEPWLNAHGIPVLP